MAISWLTALKLVPWSDVIEATPKVVKAAQALLRKKPAPTEPAVHPLDSSHAPHNTAEQALQLIARLEARIQQLELAREQSAALIEQLAEQNAQVIRTVDLLRTGAQRLAWACGILALAVVALALWRV